jgi:CubicO group peptidase (beta-lactamase class C family)
MRFRLCGAVMLITSTAIGAEHRFPNPGWLAPRDLAVAGISSAAVAEYDRWLLARGGQHWASVVIKGGYLIYSGHGPRTYLLEKHDCGSILKPLQGTVLGAALLQGRLKTLDEKALPYWCDRYETPHDNDREITFRQLTQYRDRWNDPAPAGQYRYNNSSATAAGACIAGLFRRVCGRRPAGIAEVTRAEVMRKIGADWDLWYWSADFSDNASNPGPRMVLQSSVYELAKLGYLWLRRGRWQGRRVFSEDHYREATTDWSPNTGSRQFGLVGHYGYWWFVNSNRFWLPDLAEDTFYHIGNGDPKRATCLMIVPEFDMVAVLGMTRLSDDGQWDVILNSRVPSNEGPREWSKALAALGGGGKRQ